MNPAPVMGPEHFRADLHEAKDLARLLGRLAPADRVRWLRLCCLKLTGPGGARIDVVSSTGEVLDVLLDFYSIAGQGDLTLEWATGLAEHLGRKADVREFLALSGIMGG